MIMNACATGTRWHDIHWRKKGNNKIDDNDDDDDEKWLYDRSCCDCQPSIFSVIKCHQVYQVIHLYCSAQMGNFPEIFYRVWSLYSLCVCTWKTYKQWRMHNLRVLNTQLPCSSIALRLLSTSLSGILFISLSLSPSLPINPFMIFFLFSSRRKKLSHSTLCNPLLKLIVMVFNFFSTQRK